MIMITFAAAHEAAFLLAQAAPSISPENSVTIAWGEIFATAIQYIALILISLVAWSYRFLPARIRDLLLTMQVEQLLQKSIAFGLNSVAGAVKDKTLTVEVSNRVLREALTYALMHGGDIVKRFAGNPVDLAEKIWARMLVAENVTKPNFNVIAEVAVLKSPVDRPPQEPAE
jgi:hypothetical protein